MFNAFGEDLGSYHVNIKRGVDAATAKSNAYAVIDEMLADFNRSGLKNLVLSGEDISILRKRGVESLVRYIKDKACHNVVLVAYVRDPVDWCVSSIQQRVKGGEILDDIYANLENSGKGVFRERLGKFLEVSDVDELRVFSFSEAVKSDYGIVGHFLSDIGFPKVGLGSIDYLKANSSGSQLAIEMISFVNEQVPLYLEGKLNPKRYEEDFRPLLRLTGKTFDIGNEKRAVLGKHFKEESEWLSKTFNLKLSNVSDRSVKKLNYNLDSDVKFAELEAAYIQSSFFIKDTFKEFFNREFSRGSIKESTYKKAIKCFTPDVMFRKAYGEVDSSRLTDLYKEIAILLENQGDLQGAQSMMERAAYLRPEGAFILGKLDQYKKLKNVMDSDN
ncbi:hypothetical protein MARLIPOL_01160 [Marinobacter lipolyticus SM19]|uniref:Uncharacterized protein n=2 Tax=Marinobacter lipolyticus TaxID=209639 RepID=R8B5K8_9GAMM|nr:hypothetical protein MARLIPOL_01160 [Marinobacter lipolyticus SM19]